MYRPHVIDLVGTLVRLALAAVWLVSGTSKAIDPDQTIVAVRAYNVLSRGAVDIVAAVLPFLEIAIGLLLLLGIGTRLVAVGSALLSLMFVVGVAQA
ncbi:MAG: DoxX family membrane protein, partial [Pseudonocardiales bacterium]|nr:DoxX family membrane protein [Pseudonocardiales bacterium]